MIKFIFNLIILIATMRITIAYNTLTTDADVPGYPYFPHLGFNSDNFVCNNYHSLCKNFLDGIDCHSNSSTIVSCGDPADSSVSKTLENYVGICTCSDPVMITISSSKIGKELFDNRMKTTAAWALQPWDSLPPYNIPESYLVLCNIAMVRLGCPQGESLINPNDVDITSNGQTIPAYTCSCGTYTIPSTRISELIIGKINDVALQKLPVFQDPLYLSTELSLAMTVVVGKLGSIIAQMLYLPSVVGYILAGMGIQDIIQIGLIKGAASLGAKPFSVIRSFALIIVLMRAGISLNPRQLIKKGFLTFSLAIIPFMLEWLIELFFGMSILGWNVIDMGLFASVLAPLGPSVVVSAMLKMLDEKPSIGYCAQTVLNSASLEVVLAIVLYNIFISLEQVGPNPLYPWVKNLGLLANCLLIPVVIIFSCVLGMISGYLVSQWIIYRSETHSYLLKRSWSANTAEYLLVFMIVCYLLFALCTPQYIQMSNGILAAFVCAITVSEFTPPAIIINMKDNLAAFWVFLEIFLFTTTGMNLSLQKNYGPELSSHGISPSLIGKMVQILILGQLGRLLGLIIVQMIIYKAVSTHRRTPKYMFLWILTTWIFTMPKATIQATLGGLPYASQLIPGTDGLEYAEIIMLGSAFSILFMATIGLTLTNMCGRKIAIYLRNIDDESALNKSRKLVLVDESDKEMQLELKSIPHTDTALTDLEPIAHSNIYTKVNEHDNINSSNDAVITSGIQLQQQYTTTNIDDVNIEKLEEN